MATNGTKLARDVTNDQLNMDQTYPSHLTLQQYSIGFETLSCAINAKRRVSKFNGSRILTNTTKISTTRV